jgi:hypothetical protein
VNKLAIDVKRTGDTKRDRDVTDNVLTARAKDTRVIVVVHGDI